MSGELGAPVLLVHGIWDSGERLRTMRRALERAELGPVVAINLVPNDGRAPILDLAGQIARAARALQESTGRDRIDVVGFSMGALSSRAFIQRLGGKDCVRRFVSISGPHAGTATAFALAHRGARDMRPRSDLLRALEADPDPWGEVEVHVLYTPFDLMIVPASSSRLRGARSETRVPVALHRWMIEDPRSLAHVVRVLSG